MFTKWVEKQWKKKRQVGEKVLYEGSNFRRSVTYLNQKPKKGHVLIIPETIGELRQRQGRVRRKNIIVGYLQMLNIVKQASPPFRLRPNNSIPTSTSSLFFFVKRQSETRRERLVQISKQKLRLNLARLT